MAEAALAAEGPERVGGIGEPVPAVGESEEAEGLKETGKPGGAGRVEEPVPAAGGPEEAGRPKEARGPEEAREPEEAQPMAGGPEEAESAVGRLDEPGKLGKPAAASSLLWSDCWQAFALAAALFCCCFSFFNRLVFSQGSSLSSSLSSPVAIASTISPLSAQSTLVHPSQSFFSESYLALGGPTSKSLIGPMCILMVKRIEVATFEVFSTSSCSNNFSKLLVVWYW